MGFNSVQDQSSLQNNLVCNIEAKDDNVELLRKVLQDEMKNFEIIYRKKKMIK